MLVTVSCFWTAEGWDLFKEECQKRCQPVAWQQTEPDSYLTLTTVALWKLWLSISATGPDQYVVSATTGHICQSKPWSKLWSGLQKAFKNASFVPKQKEKRGMFRTCFEVHLERLRCTKRLWNSFFRVKPGNGLRLPTDTDVSNKARKSESHGIPVVFSHFQETRFAFLSTLMRLFLHSKHHQIGVM